MEKLITFLKRTDIRFFETISASIFMMGFALYCILIGKSAFYITALVFYTLTAILKVITFFYYKKNITEKTKLLTVSIFGLLELIIIPVTMYYGLFIKENYNNVFGIMIYVYSAYGIFKFTKSIFLIFYKKDDYSTLVNNPLYDLITSFYTIFLVVIGLYQTFGNLDEVRPSLIIVGSAFIIVIAVINYLLFKLYKKQKEQAI